MALRAVFAYDRARFALFRRWRGAALDVAPDASPNLRFAEVRIEPGGRLAVGRGFASERRRGNHLWIQAGGEILLGERVWLRTEHGANRLTAFPGGRIRVGARALLNGAMLHAKRSITVGEDALLGFGVRVFDADLHDLDCETPERIDAVTIGARTWIGADVIVLRGVTIGDDTAVAAGSVVTRDLPPRVLAIGAPAKPVREIASRAGCR
jgi:maltose O-acetyltransferase